MDEIETKLLKGCGTSDAIPYEDDYVCCGHLEEGGEVLICKECEGKIIQHRETKKWIEGLIDNFKFEEHITSNMDYPHDFIDPVVIKRELKKQISGAEK